MSKFYHFNPPKRENYRTDEEYEEALEEWEWAEDEYAENAGREDSWRMNNQIFI